MIDGPLLLVLIALPFAGSVVAMLLPAKARNASAWLASTVALAALVLACSIYATVASGTVVRVDFEWFAHVDFALRMDGFAWLFSVVVTGIGFLITLYARYYMSPQDPVARFYSFLLAFMGSMLGVVIAGNLILLVFFWELTSLASFFLIGYWHHNASARDGARMALIVTSGGGLCLLAGVLILGHIVGSYDLDRVLAAREAIVGHELYLPALILILLGALTKSAQFPFHFWLPHAMTAPTPVSAYLHSAAMVKLGVFLLARLWPVLSGTDAWIWIVGTAGLVTFCLGAYVAIFQQDLKGLLAYSTISHLGLITLLLGLNSPLACVAAIFHMLNHATFKASLFMATGIIDHETGTRDIRRLSGLLPVHADHGDARHGGRGGDGGRAAAQRLPVEGDVLRRGARRRRTAAVARSRAAVRRHDRGDVQRHVFGALHPRRVLRTRPRRPAARAARAATLDAPADRRARGRLRRRRRVAGADDRPAPRTSRSRPCSATPRRRTASRRGTASRCRC